MKFRSAEGAGAYLPTYNRKNIGVSGNINPNTSGFQYAQSTNNQFWKHVDNFFEGASNLVQTYHAVQEKRDIRDTETLAHETIRQRQIDVFASRIGKKADGVLEDEDEWQTKAREEIVKASGLDAEMAANIWDKQASQYLDKVGAHMLQENKVAEAESKYAAQMSAQHDLAQTQIGDFKSLATYMVNMRGMYGMGKEFEKSVVDGINTVVDTWAAVDPNATVQWFNTNKEQLRTVLGKNFSDVNNALATVERRLLTAAQRSVANQQSQLLREQRAQDALDKKLQGEFISKLISGENVDLNAEMTNILSNGATPEAAMKLQDVFISFHKQDMEATKMPEQRQAEALNSHVYDLFNTNGMSLQDIYDSIDRAQTSSENKAAARKIAADLTEAAETKKEDLAQPEIEAWEKDLLIRSRAPGFDLDAEVTKAIKDGVPKDDVLSMRNALTTLGQPKTDSYNAYSTSAIRGTLDEQALIEAASKGEVTKEQYASIVDLNTKTQKVIQDQIKPMWDIAIDHLENAIAPNKGMFSASNPTAIARNLSLVSMLTEAVNSTEGIPAKMKLLDINDANSLVNQLINANIKAPMENMNESMSRDVLSVPAAVVDPTTQTSVIVPRLPDDTTKTYLKRINQGN